MPLVTLSQPEKDWKTATGMGTCWTQVAQLCDKGMLEMCRGGPLSLLSVNWHEKTDVIMAASARAPMTPW